MEHLIEPISKLQLQIPEDMELSMHFVVDQLCAGEQNYKNFTSARHPENLHKGILSSPL